MKKFLMGGGILAALIAIGGAVAAQGPGGFGPGFGRGPGGPGGPGGPLMGLHGLNLTDAQREQVRSIMESHQSEFQQMGTRLRAAHEALADATHSGTVDEAAIRAKAAELGTALGDDAVLRARVHSEILAILTPEQQQELAQRREQMDQRRPRAGRGRGR